MSLILLLIGFLILFFMNRSPFIKNHPNRIIIMIAGGLILFLVLQLISMYIYKKHS